jgi:peptide chain release factor 1
MDSNTEPLRKEYQEIINEISNPDIISDWEKFEKISKRKKKIENIIEKEDELSKLIKEKSENKIILSKEEDSELLSLAEEEIRIIDEKKEIIEKDLKKLIETIDEEEIERKEGSVIVEIRAGAGGDEAALFSENLFRMYSRYAENKGWKLKILNSNRTEIGGLKEIVFELKNGDVYSYMKYEAGVHRVQRVPETEKSGRIHTSTASVIVLLKPKRGKIKIMPADLKVDTYKASGPGGQYVNKRMSAIRITYTPTNTVVTSQTERSLAQNKNNAMAILEARILEDIERKQEEKTKKERKNQVTTSDRSEKIKTYNFPQDRLTDHRIQKNWSNLEKIMDGDIDSVIETVKKESEQKAHQ